MGRVKESREDRRLGPIIIRARFRIDGQDREGYLTNLSAGGAFLATEESLEIGESLDLKITLPWALGEVWVEARIVWSTERAGRAAQHLPLGVGLAF
ncbi:MAG: PilZ domain-containing protein, partial [Acidobacteriota bacterium]